MPTDIDIIVSLLLGGACGWFVGGLWNLLQGKTWNGH